MAANGNTNPATQTPDGTPIEQLPIAGTRRLTNREYAASVKTLLSVDISDEIYKQPQGVPKHFAFDTDFASQTSTATIVEEYDALATLVTARADFSDAAINNQAGCTPAAPDDADCLRKFTAKVGRRILRRALATDEIDALVAAALPYAAQGAANIEAPAFANGAKLIVYALLQFPDFLYISEAGVAQNDVLRKLTGFEVAARLSYVIWGTTPDDTLLDAAENGALETSEQVQLAAARMLADPRAIEMADALHAMWFGYYAQQVAPGFDTSKRAESHALVQRVLFDEKKPWTELLTFSEAYINAELATVYGLPAPPNGTAFAWTADPQGQRKGLLSEASVLAAGAVGSDTSITRRGAFIRDRVLCDPVPPPPPDVNVDAVFSTTSGVCKVDRFKQHGQGTCASCHDQLDPIGIGLERFDISGRFRANEQNRPECPLDGQGRITLEGTVSDFNGPAQLGELVAASPQVKRCATQQLWEFTLGRAHIPEDQPMLDKVTQGFVDGGATFQALLTQLVGSSSFMYVRSQ